MPDRKPNPEPASRHETKTCASCGRTMTWRKKWERNWDVVRFCSDACRGKKRGPGDAELEQAILELLRARGREKTICPSEAARMVAASHPPHQPSEDREPWRELMEPAQAAARRLAARGTILITQNGHRVDPSTAKGPIRLRLA
jgi:hypothetical protein